VAAGGVVDFSASPGACFGGFWLDAGVGVTLGAGASLKGETITGLGLWDGCLSRAACTAWSIGVIWTCLSLSLLFLDCRRKTEPPTRMMAESAVAREGKATRTTTKRTDPSAMPCLGKLAGILSAIT